MKLDIGYSSLPVDYEKAMAIMQSYHQKILVRDTDQLIWFLEHPDIYTAGTSANESELLDPNRFPIYRTGRGGKYTYHGRGQRIIYLIVDLKQIYEKPDIRLFIQQLEQCVINTLARFGIEAKIKEGYIGMWVKHEGFDKKIAAVGIRVKRWVTLHGISVNVFPELDNFSGIIPCGITDHGVTSLRQLGIDTSYQQFDQYFTTEFSRIFGFNIGKKYEIK